MDAAAWGRNNILVEMLEAQLHENKWLAWRAKVLELTAQRLKKVRSVGIRTVLKGGQKSAEDGKTLLGRTGGSVCA